MDLKKKFGGSFVTLVTWFNHLWRITWIVRHLDHSSPCKLEDIDFIYFFIFLTKVLISGLVRLSTHR